MLNCAVDKAAKSLESKVRLSAAENVLKCKKRRVEIV